MAATTSTSSTWRTKEMNIFRKIKTLYVNAGFVLLWTGLRDFIAASCLLQAQASLPSIFAIVDMPL
jgi:hypothetical protein